MYRAKHLLHDEVKDVTPGSTGYAAVPPVEAPPPEDKPNDPADSPPAEAAGDPLEFYGNKDTSKEPPKEDPKTGEKETTKPEEKLEDIKEPATGYGTKPLDPPKEEKVDPPKEEVSKDAPKQVVLDTKGLPEQEAKRLADFATANNFSPEQAQKIIDLRKVEFAQAVDIQKSLQKKEQDRIQGIRAGWDKDLRGDGDFGGANFDKNILKCEKVLSEFMPDTKKELTARGSMLPPYVMRDLAKLADRLYAAENFVTGEEGAGAPDKKQEDEGTGSPLDFYEMKKK